MTRTLRTIDPTGTIERVPVYHASEEYHNNRIHYDGNEPTYKWWVLKDGLVWQYRTRKAARAKIDENVKGT